MAVHKEIQGRKYRKLQKSTIRTRYLTLFDRPIHPVINPLTPLTHRAFGGIRCPNVYRNLQGAHASVITMYGVSGLPRATGPA